MQPPTNIDDYRWLIGPEAAQWLPIAAAESRQPGFSSVRLAARLRAELSAARTRLVLQQVELRQRGREKFSRAEVMFFTPLGLEQATDELLAAYKAGRFPRGELAADLCCGIGGDAMGLARRGPVLAVDRDPVAVIFAEANLRASGVEIDGELDKGNTATLRSSDIDDVLSGQLDLRNVAAWHIDPDRRPTGRRTTKVELHEPGPEVIRALLAVNSNAAVKLAPAAELSESWWYAAELEWISRGRQCRQLVAWFAALSQQPGRHRATIIGGQFGEPPVIAASFVGEPNVECEIATQVGRYVFEPDAAVLAAKLEGALAAKHGLTAVAGGVAYFTGDRAPDDAALAGFEVMETMPYDVKRLKAWLGQRRIGRLEIKKRGVPLDPEQVRRELRAAGDEDATVLFARIAGQVTAIIAKRRAHA